MAAAVGLLIHPWSEDKVMDTSTQLTFSSVQAMTPAIRTAQIKEGLPTSVNLD